MEPWSFEVTTEQMKCCHIDDDCSPCGDDAEFGIYHEESGRIHDTLSCAAHLADMLTVDDSERPARHAWFVTRIFHAIETLS